MSSGVVYKYFLLQGTFLFIFIFYFMYMWPTCMSAPCACNAHRSHKRVSDPYGWLLTTMWLLGTEFESSARAILVVLNC